MPASTATETGATGSSARSSAEATEARVVHRSGAAGPLRFYNTWTRRVEAFTTVAPGKVGLYCCGPTVYDYVHIGNLRTFIFVDLLRRVLEKEGYEVKHVENITDVGHLTSDADEGEDKMERGARRHGRSAWEIAEFYTAAFKRDVERLQIKEPHVWCRATDHIPEMIDLILEIERRGFTYRTSDGIYFDTSLLPDYGHLARLDITGQMAGARIGPHEEKRHPQDFALWKFSPPNEQRQMEWESPWGVGFPGWHIECSAMSAKYLGVPFDIHAGGIDLIPVHHTNEIAQTKAATGKLLANWWMHGEFLDVKEQKMSRSSGNFITLQALLDRGIDPMAYRYMTYQAHYRTQLAFSEETLKAAVAGHRRLHELTGALPAEPGDPDPAAMERFWDALRDDLNAPRAMAVLWETVRDETIAPAVRRATLLAMNEVLPLGLDAVQPGASAGEAPPEIVALLERRQAARQARDFATADALRAQIAAAGWEVRDTPKGPELVRR